MCPLCDCFDAAPEFNRSAVEVHIVTKHALHIMDVLVDDKQGITVEFN